MSTQKNPLNFPSHLTEAPNSHYSTSFEFYPGQFSKVDKKTDEKVYKPIKNAPMQTIAVNLVESEGVQKLTFTYSATDDKPEIIGSFNLHPDMTLEWVTDPKFGEIKKLVAISAYSALTVQVTSLGQLFTYWLMDDDFTSNAKVLASRLVYPPKLMKMIYLWLAYHDERSGKGWEEQELSEKTEVSLDKVGQKFKGYIERFAGGVAYMQPYYSVPDTFRLFAPGQVAQIASAEETQSTEKVEDPTTEPITEKEELSESNTTPTVEVVTEPANVEPIAETLEDLPAIDVPQVTDNQPNTDEIEPATDEEAKMIKTIKSSTTKK